jgi:predicted nucleotidyltransferase|tara:strand:+ start:1037 stop:1879 length:843 start_codon:yes stop_codon:yes gene_type:complete
MRNFNKIWKKYVKNQDLFEYKNIFAPKQAHTTPVVHFEVHDQLNPKIWLSGARIKPEVKEKLLRITQDFVEDADLDVDIVDLILTGSMANLNWTKFSDIDLHIVINFRDIDHNRDLVKELLKQRQINWNMTHDIRIFGHEVEIYVQDKDEKHVSTGIYSILQDRWLIKTDFERPKIHLESVENKVEKIVDLIEKVQDLYNSERYNESFDVSGRLKKKIKNMRSSGLEKNGMFSTENMAFKFLRNSNYLDDLHDLYNDSYDKMLSIDDRTRPTPNIPGNTM